MSNKNAMYYTQEGYDTLVNELNYLKNTRRAEIAHDIEVARGFGDLSENAEYDEARNEQAKVEARIKELDEKIRHAIIVDESTIDSDIISVGSTVTVYDHDMESEEVYSIVGSNEVDPVANRISDLSFMTLGIGIHPPELILLATRLLYEFCQVVTTYARHLLHTDKVAIELHDKVVNRLHRLIPASCRISLSYAHQASASIVCPNIVGTDTEIQLLVILWLCICREGDSDSHNC